MKLVLRQHVHLAGPLVSLAVRTRRFHAIHQRYAAHQALKQILCMPANACRRTSGSLWRPLATSRLNPARCGFGTHASDKLGAEILPLQPWNLVS